ncbi:MAG: UbiA family prenyltransferase [bacterium]
MTIIRPLNGLIGAVSVFIGALLTHTPLNPVQVLFACLVCFFIISAGNVLNDYADIEIDKINKPKTLIASGKLKPNQALGISIILFIIGLVLSIELSSPMFLVALSTSLLLFLYNFNLKKAGISGNLLVAFLGGLPFVYGGVLQNNWTATIPPFLFAFLLHLARELLKDIQDINGDKVGNAVSFPIKYGIKPSIRLTVSILIILILFTPIPFLLNLYGFAYLITVILFIDIPIIFLIYKVLKNNSFVPTACNILKFNMLIGLVVLALGYYK